MQIPGFPYEVDVLGSYSAAAISGTIAAGMAGDSDIFQMRWTHPRALAVVTELSCGGITNAATAFTVGFGAMRMLRAQAWTTGPSGGSNIVPTPLAPYAGASLVGTSDLRAPTTAALTGGTRVNAADSMGYLPLTFDTGTSKYFLTPTTLFAAKEDLLGALVLRELEGFAVKATVPATGTWQTSFWARWLEVMPRY